MCPALEAGCANREDHPRILVLDPDPRIAEALALAMRRQAQVEWVPSGIAGLLLVATQEVDLVIAEAHLPDMSSADLVDFIRSMQPRLPIAILGESPHIEPPGGGEQGLRFLHPVDLRLVLAWITDRLGGRPACFLNPVSPPAPEEIPTQHLDVVRRVLEYIERHDGEGTPLAVIARRAGVSRSHLCRIFKRVTGLSLNRFLTRRRLQAAKALLRQPGVTIHQVACRAGYPDASHFDRVFRRWEGQTPSRYRRQAILQEKRTGYPPARHPHFLSNPPSCI